MHCMSQAKCILSQCISATVFLSFDIFNITPNFIFITKLFQLNLIFSSLFPTTTINSFYYLTLIFIACVVIYIYFH